MNYRGNCLTHIRIRKKTELQIRRASHSHGLFLLSALSELSVYGLILNEALPKSVMAVTGADVIVVPSNGFC